MAETKTTPRNQKPELAACEECGAPMDEKQRYCVSCGNRGKDSGAPAVQYFAGAARSKRRAGSGGKAGQSSGGRAAAVLFFVLLPIAVAVGVLVGRGGGEDNSELIAAIEEAGSGGGGGTELASADVATVASTYTLDEGFTVLVDTLPAEGTDQAAADAAVADAEKQGATDAGIINPSDFTVDPDQGGEYVVYSGEFKTKTEADKALADLKGKFKDAVVLEVTRAAGAAGGGKVIAQTKYGSVSQVAGFEATPEKEAADAPIVDEISKKIGDDFVGAQKDLPDVIVVGGDGGGPSGPDN